MSSTSGYESSEGTAELIERLIVTCLKHAAPATAPPARLCLGKSASKIGADLTDRLGVTNATRLWEAIGDCVSDRPVGASGWMGLVVELCEANRLLYRLKDEQANAARCPVGDAEYLLALIRRDLALCKMRAEVRAKLNVALGGQSSGESVKNYGG